VEEAPRQHAGRVVGREVAGHEEEEPRHDGTVYWEAAARDQAPVSRLALTGMRDPQEHTRARTAHSIRSRRPHAGHPM
jgi:hypothetical protein